MYLSIIILPLLGSILSGFFGRKIGVTGAQIITTSFVMITTLLAIIAFFEVGLNSIPVSLHLFSWIDSESLNVLWKFNFDSLTVSMLIPVLIVSSLVHLYSIGYMSHDPHNQRFFSYLSLFTFMMIILVTANNFLLMFVGWEGVGICSYLLVSFWFTRIAANQSSLSALLTNRVGDCFLTIGMFAILWSFGNIDYATVFSLAPYISENIVLIIGICLLIGAMAKSSQVGLHVWLPMAMEGPTPVSALIHAATMVTAGVYLLMRSSPLIEYSSVVLLLCLWLGALTTVFSSLIGLFQQDIKKVIAYSTMSQLGMMVIAVGLSSYNVALFHLINHAFYKALLFLGAGSVIHAVADNQDFRRYGGLREFLPLSYSVMLIASLSLVAFPFMTGFYSKDFILESAFGGYKYSSISVYFIATIGAIFTTLYSVKVLYLTFLGNPTGSLNSYKNTHEGDIFMSLPLIILAVFSIFFGYITKDMFIGLGTGLFTDNGLFMHPNHEITIDTEFSVPTLFKLLPLIFTLLSITVSLILLEFSYKPVILFKYSKLGYNIFSFFNQRFYIELFYNKYVTDLTLKLGGQTTKILDKGSIEWVGPYGLELGLHSLSNIISKLSSGIITNYAVFILIGLISYIIIPNLSDESSILLLFVMFSVTLFKYKDSISAELALPKTLKSSIFQFKSFKSKLISSLLIFFFFSLIFKYMTLLLGFNMDVIISLVSISLTYLVRVGLDVKNTNRLDLIYMYIFYLVFYISKLCILNYTDIQDLNTLYTVIDKWGETGFCLVISAFIYLIRLLGFIFKPFLPFFNLHELPIGANEVINIGDNYKPRFKYYSFHSTPSSSTEEVNSTPVAPAAPTVPDFPRDIGAPNPPAALKLYDKLCRTYGISKDFVETEVLTRIYRASDGKPFFDDLIYKERWFNIASAKDRRLMGLNIRDYYATGELSAMKAAVSHMANISRLRKEIIGDMLGIITSLDANNQSHEIIKAKWNLYLDLMKKHESTIDAVNKHIARNTNNSSTPFYMNDKPFDIKQLYENSGKKKP